MDKTNALSLTGGGMFDGGWTPVWLIKDEFTDTVTAGSVNGTAATPGPGTRTVTDTENKLSVGSGALAIAGGKASPAGGDPGVWYDAQTRAAGLAQITKLAITSGTLYATFDTNLTSIGEFGFNAINGSLYTSINTLGSAVLDSVMSGTSYTHATVARESGYFSIIKGDGISNWRLMWVGNTHTTASIYPGIQNLTSVCIADYLRVLQLPAPFDTDDGLATDTHSGSVAAGTTFSHEADCLIEFTVTTLGVGDGTRVWIRSQDSNNYFYVYIGGGTGNFGLYEVVSGGTPVQRANLNSAVATGHRVVIIADGTTIKGYSNNVLCWTYSSATNFATATAGKLSTIATSGAVSNLKTYPFGDSLALATYSWPVSVPAGTTFTHEADCLIEFTVTTVPSAGFIVTKFRAQDSSSSWGAYISSSGNFGLNEYVSGTPTLRGVAAGVVSNGHRVVIIADGTTIKGYSNNTLRWTYSSATNFATSTAGEVDALGTGGAVSDLKTWPRTLSGTAASILNKASG